MLNYEYYPSCKQYDQAAISAILDRLICDRNYYRHLHLIYYFVSIYFSSFLEPVSEACVCVSSSPYTEQENIYPRSFH